MNINNLPNGKKPDNLNLDWKQVLKEVYLKLGIIHSKFTGKVVVNVNEGGISDRENTERHK